MEPTPYTLPPGYEPAPPPQPPWWKRLFGPVALALFIGVKFFAKLKFLILPALKFIPVILASVWAFVFTYAMLWLIDRVVTVRVSSETEEGGLDVGLHGEEAYGSL